MPTGWYTSITRPRLWTASRCVNMNLCNNEQLNECIKMFHVAIVRWMSTKLIFVCNRAHNRMLNKFVMNLIQENVWNFAVHRECLCSSRCSRLISSRFHNQVKCHSLAWCLSSLSTELHNRGVRRIPTHTDRWHQFRRLVFLTLVCLYS